MFILNANPDNVVEMKHTNNELFLEEIKATKIKKSLKKKDFNNLFVEKAKEVIGTPLDLIHLAIDNYPLTSVEFNRAYKLFSLEYLYDKYPEEYVLCRVKPAYTEEEDYACADTDGKHNSVEWQFLPRRDIEWNPNIIQVSVAAIIKCSDNKFILLHSIKGNMQGLHTMVQGHCSFTTTDVIPSIGHKSTDWGAGFDGYLAAEIQKEISEEISLDLEIGTIVDSPKHYVHPARNPHDIGYYHEGFIYEITVPLTSDEILKQKIDSEESVKHNVIALTSEELHQAVEEQKTDSWLNYAVNRLFIA